MRQITGIRTLVALGVVCAPAALAATASASVFCVPDYHPACPNNGTNDNVGTLDLALSGNGTDGEADTAIIDTGMFTDPDSFSPSGSDPLTVRGAGPAATRLTSSATTDIAVLDLAAGGNTRSITVRDLTVAGPRRFPMAPAPSRASPATCSRT